MSTLPNTFALSDFNFIDPEGISDAATLVVLSGPSNGSISGLTAGGEATFPLMGVDYTPNADYNGIDSFTYKIIDDEGFESEPYTVTLNIASVDDQVMFDDAALPSTNPATFNTSGADDTTVIFDASDFVLDADLDDATQTPGFVDYTYALGGGTAFSAGFRVDSDTGELTHISGGSNLSTTANPYEIVLTVTDTIGTDTHTFYIDVA